MLTDAHPIPDHHNLIHPLHHPSQDDASTAASSPSTHDLAIADDHPRHDTEDDTEGVSPEVPSTVADLDHEPHISLKNGDEVMTDAADIDGNAGLEPQPELATEPISEQPSAYETTEPQAVDDAMDIDVGINVNHLPTPPPPTAVPALDSQPTLDAASPAQSNNTMPSTLDQMRLTPKLASRSPTPARSRSPPATVNGSAADLSASASLPQVAEIAPSADFERPAKRQRSDMEGNSVSVRT